MQYLTEAGYTAIQRYFAAHPATSNFPTYAFTRLFYDVRFWTTNITDEAIGGRPMSFSATASKLANDYLQISEETQKLRFEVINEIWCLHRKDYLERQEAEFKTNQLQQLVRTFDQALIVLSTIAEKKEE
jgi:hypothetical protein